MKKIFTLSLLIAASAFAQSPTPTATPWLQGTQYDKFAVVDASLGLKIATASDATIASAATLNLNNVVGPQIDVTGTTTITAITLTAGERRILRFTGALTLTNSANLLCPNSADIPTVAGGYAIVIGRAGAVVDVQRYVPADFQIHYGGDFSTYDSFKTGGTFSTGGAVLISDSLSTSGNVNIFGTFATVGAVSTNGTVTTNGAVYLSGPFSTIGASSLALTTTGITDSTLPAGIHALAQTDSPTFTGAPNIAAATGTSLALGSDPADAGVLRLENAAVIGWEASPAGTDVTLTVNSSEQFVFSNAILSPTLVTPALGTPASGVATNLTGTASGLTAGNVTTNANLTGDVTSSGNATTLTNAPVIAKVLTGYTSGSGTVAATDTILQAIQKLNGNDALKATLASPTFTGTVNAGPVTLTGVLTNSTTINAPMMTSGPNAGGTCGYILFDASANGGKKWRNQASVSVVGDFGFYNESDSLVAFTASANGDLNVTGKVIPNKPVKLKGYTVATLPTGAQGDTCFVTDALAPTFLATVVGGGAVVTPVFYNGTNWVGY